MPEIQTMIGKEVEVIANGLSYNGVLMSVSDTEVYLKGLLQWFFLPTETVNTIKLKPK
jgi:hypothetical protein